LFAGAIGAVAASVVGLAPWAGVVPGLPLVLLVLVVLDRRRTWLGSVGFGWTDDLTEVDSVAEELRRRGVEVRVQAGEEDGPSLTFRRRDQRVVAEVLGLPSGRFPWR